MAIGGRAIGDDPAVLDALAQSHLRDLPADVTMTLLDSATWVHAPAGSTVREVGEPGPYLHLVVAGFLRVLVRSPDGRSLTVRYIRPGELSGVVSLYTPDYALAATVQALVDSDLIDFRSDVVIALAERDLRVARFIIDELSERVVNFVAEIPGSAFSTVRQRIARHLLDLAAEARAGRTDSSPTSASRPSPTPSGRSAKSSSGSCTTSGPRASSGRAATGSSSSSRSGSPTNSFPAGRLRLAVPGSITGSAGHDRGRAGQARLVRLIPRRNVHEPVDVTLGRGDPDRDADRAERPAGSRARRSSKSGCRPRANTPSISGAVRPRAVSLAPGLQKQPVRTEIRRSAAARFDLPEVDDGAGGVEHVEGDRRPAIEIVGRSVEPNQRRPVRMAQRRPYGQAANASATARAGGSSACPTDAR